MPRRSLPRAIPGLERRFSDADAINAMPLRSKLTQVPGIFASGRPTIARVKAELFRPPSKPHWHPISSTRSRSTPNALHDLTRHRPRSPGSSSPTQTTARAAAEFSQEFSVPIFAHAATLRGRAISAVTVSGQRWRRSFSGTDRDRDRGRPRRRDRASLRDDGGTLIVGDALINFEPHGFAFLPPKYCSNPKQMRRSLRKLLDYDFERMLFAHGTPILHGARARRSSNFSRQPTDLTLGRR